MSRPKGSKNKPQTTEELIRILHERNIPIPDTLIPDSGIIKAPAKHKELTAGQVESSGVKREKFELAQNKPKGNQAQQTVFRCGNTLCNKLLDSELSHCPYCGAKLTWE